MTDLFAPLERSTARPAPEETAPAPTQRRPRFPGTGDPREHVCACGTLACYGHGNVWTCGDCTPESFFVLARGGRR